jgi:hypothetical protein
MPHRVVPDRRRADRDRDRGSIVAGVLAFLACLSTFADPGSLEPSSLAEVLDGKLLYVWASLYGLGGLLIVLGGAFRRTDLEAPGLHLFVAGMVVNGLAIMAVRGGAGSAITLAPFVAFGWIALGRIRDLRRSQHNVQRAIERERRLVVGPALFVVLASTTGEFVQTLVVAVLGAGILNAVIDYWRQRRTAKDTEELTEAQAEKVRQEAGTFLDARWRNYVTALETRLAAADARIAELEEREQECEEQRERLEKRVEEITAVLVERGIRPAGA